MYSQYILNPSQKLNLMSKITIHLMKNLLIMRHAKSGWEFTNLPNHDRPLNDRGKRDAPRMGKVLLKERLVPQLIISFQRPELGLRLRKLPKCLDIVVKFPLIRCTGRISAYLNALRHQTSQYDTVLIVGHNPDVEHLVEILTGNTMTMPTCGLAYVRLLIERWPDLKDDKKGELANASSKRTVTPRVFYLVSTVFWKFLEQ